ncbi:hypothetical protein FQN49_003957 [Arthroderma sp. PD_2]|nr:hypothetical protein FQN49_003957 [Arthroderma sp. PD_2]
MDLKTIINSDTAVGARSSSSQPANQRQNHHQHQRPPSQPLSLHAQGPDGDSPLRSSSFRDDGAQHPEYGGGGGRPSQPHPLQPPLQSPKRMPSYISTAQSPYQQAPLASILTGREALGERAGVLSGPRDSFAVPASLPPPSAVSLSSPFTPQPTSAGTQHSYFSQPRSHSIHSAASPSSVRSLSYPSGREPPPQAPPYSPGQQQHQQQLQLQQQQQQRSQPGTPLAPPSSSSYRRPSPHPVRPPSSGHEAPLSARLGSPWGSQDASAGGQRDGVSPTVHTPLSRHNSVATESYPRQYSMEREKEQHPDSVSPKTIVSQQGAGQYDSSSNSNNNINAINQPNLPVQTPHKDAEMSQQTNYSGMENSHPTHATGRTAQALYPPSTPQAASHPSTSLGHSITSTGSPTSQRPVKEISPTHRQLTPSKPHNNNMSAASSTSDRAPMYPPRKKRKRYTQPPIFACKAPRTTGTPPPIPPKSSQFHSQSHSQPPPPFFPGKRPLPKHENSDRHITPDSGSISLPPRPPQTMKGEETAVNGNAVKEPAPDSPLGPWEPSVTNVIPSEELTKMICDFLFQHVVMRKDIGAGPAGGVAVGSGAILEVEAKLGRLVDKNRGERLRLPILTECVISKDDPNLRLAFESSMSQAQHRAMNNFLNETVKTSISQGTARIPLAYAHKRERDTFYEISASDLPPIVQHHLHPRHKPKVRVTTDIHTGAILARIVKCRIADLDVYSPRTCLDWRISVNLEMNYEGDMSKLQQANDWKRSGDRNKDRMSYRHLAYQIDLTQVGTSDSAPSDFEHELEIEISSAEIRRQGDLALSGDMSNRYEELIKGFVDNIRVLARAVPV